MKRTTTHLGHTHRLALLSLAGLAVILLGPVAAQRSVPAAPVGSDAIPAMGMQVLGPTELLSGSPAALRVIVTDRRKNQPLPEAQVSLYLARADKGKEIVTLVRGRTDEKGSLEAQFEIPEVEPGSYEIRVSASSPLGQEKASQRIVIKREHQILLTTDKPIYQPGQVMHLRALALRRPGLQAAGTQPLTLEVSDAKGNKVFKKQLESNEFGIAAADFQLADEVNLGRYQVRAILAETKTEKTVTVDRYVLPKFKVVVKLDKDYYLPGETLKGTVQCDYFFGKPVAGAEAEIKLSTFDVQLTEIADIKGKTEGDGSSKFEQKLPEHFVGQPLEQGNAYLQVDATIKDTADHIERSTKTAQVAAAPIRVNAVPESGKLVPGVANTVFIMTTYPDGSPARCRLLINGAAAELRTDDLGVARYQMRPQPGEVELKVAARDEKGNTAIQTVKLEADTQAEPLLLRTDQALYKVGQTLRCAAITPAKRGTVFFDVVKDRQTMLTLAADLQGGRAETSITLGPELQGSIWVRAYRILPSEDIVRDTKVVYVDPADNLNIEVQPDRQVYGPAQEARVQFRVRDEHGRPVPAALGLNIVDESVFALQELQPGLEKVYFLLEHELMTPKYEIHGFEPQQIVRQPMPGPGWAVEMQAQQRRQEAARVLFAAAELPEQHEFYVDTFAQKLAALKTKWAQKMVKDAQRMQNALAAFQRKHNRALTYKDGLRALVADKFLTYNDIRDQWGNEYKLVKEPWRGPDDDYVYTIYLSSPGPDHQENTVDDVVGVPPWEVAEDVFEGRGGGMGGMRDRRMMVQAPVSRAAAGMPGMAVAAPMAADGDVLRLRAEMSKSGELVPTSAVGAEPARQEVRVREFFPETMYTNPALITDAQGNASLQLTMADSITTWRMTAIANSVLGALGSTTAPLKVFQDFFIDLDLPVALTQGDQVSIPVAVYNYLPVTQKVRLELTKEKWFELNGEATAELSIGSNEVSVAYFTVTAKDLGDHKLTVHGYGSKMSDAISREIEIQPNGQLQESVVSGRLDKDVIQTVEIPRAAIDGASDILVKVYPGIFAQAVEGLDSILQMPFGCFEQTSSTTYPNILVLDYMKRTNQINAEIRMKAEGYINVGYQRLLTFEVKGGGFSWFGDAPANKVLTAYGVMEFTDMAQVHEVDPAVIRRTQEWLLGQQDAEGSWSPDKAYLHEEAWGRIQHNKMLPTAYVTWALLDSSEHKEVTGVAKSDPRLQKAASWLRQHIADADEPYVLALLCNAVVAANADDPKNEEALTKLIGMAKEKDDKLWWESKVATITFSRGQTADIEATALAGYALIQSGRHPVESTKVLNYLIASKDPHGTWGSTQGTVLALKCMTASLRSATQKVNAEVSVLSNGQNVAGFALTQENSDVLQLVAIRQGLREGANDVKIKFSGQGSALYSIVTRYYLPWERVAEPARGPLSIGVKYDKTELEKNDVVRANVEIRNNRAGTMDMVIVDLGLPPGFSVEPGDLEELVGSRIISKFSPTGRQIIVYLDKIEAGRTIKFSYGLRARFPIRAQTPKSQAYLYYEPQSRAVARPVEMVVRQG